MTSIVPQPLTATGFAPFGEVLAAPAEPGRTYFDNLLRNDRPGAAASLFLTTKAPMTGRTLRVTVMERHRFSSQSFVPLMPFRWLALVAPHARDGGPDMDQAVAFLAGPGQGVTFAADVWHHPMTVLDAGQFAVLMWRDGSADDEEFRPVIPFDLPLD